MCDLSAPQFHDVDKAREYLEALRWPNGPICPHCGSDRKAWALKGKKHRPGLYRCADCKEQFTVTVGTFHHVGPQHLRRYVGEFDFRWNNRKVTDKERADNALRGIAGKRLLYGGIS